MSQVCGTNNLLGLIQGFIRLVKLMRYYQSFFKHSMYIYCDNSERCSAHQERAQLDEAAVYQALK